MLKKISNIRISGYMLTNYLDGSSVIYYDGNQYGLRYILEDGEIFKKESNKTKNNLAYTLIKYDLSGDFIYLFDHSGVKSCGFNVKNVNSVKVEDNNILNTRYYKLITGGKPFRRIE
jgi:hypothetical protein